MSSNIKNPQRLDPDVRFLLANERTLLAWVRTAIALQAGGLALTQFAESPGSGVAIGCAIVLLGCAMALLGYRRFVAAEKAIRNHSLPPVGHGPLLQVIAIIGLGIGLTVTIFLGLW